VTARARALVLRRVLHFALSYLGDLCRLVSDVAACRLLRSAARGELIIGSKGSLDCRAALCFLVVE